MGKGNPKLIEGLKPEFHIIPGSSVLYSFRLSFRSVFLGDFWVRPLKELSYHFCWTCSLIIGKTIFEPKKEDKQCPFTNIGAMNVVRYQRY